MKRLPASLGSFVRKLALGALFSLFWATFAHAAFYPNAGWFWIVGDTTPAAGVWKGDAGAMEANTSTDYQAFVGSRIERRP